MPEQHLFLRPTWRLKVSAGEHHVWHSGIMHYSITLGKHGEVIAARRSLGEAFTEARRLHEVSKVRP